jgi:hypothetical protein
MIFPVDVLGKSPTNPTARGQVVETFPADGADQPLDVRVLPRRSGSGRLVPGLAAIAGLADLSDQSCRWDYIERVSARGGLCFGETGFHGKRQKLRNDLPNPVALLQRLIARSIRLPGRGYSTNLGKSCFKWKRVVRPGVVPRHDDFTNLGCQTAENATTDAKGNFLLCKTGTANRAA